jgi:hypothetical protein
MKRIMPSSLITFLQNTPNITRQDLFVITLPTGETMCATDGQWDITLLGSTPGWTGGQTTFFSKQFGVWTRGKITTEATVKCDSNTMDLFCVPQPNTVYPGLSVGILSAALNHLFDAATVWVYTVYMPIGNYGNVSAGVETKFQGSITKVPELSRNKVQFECADPFFLLNMKVPSRLIQTNCPWSFCDSNCTLSAANYTVNFEAAGGSTQSILVPSSAFTQAAGYFAQGVVKCLSGQNAGLSQTVKASSGTITMMVSWPMPVRAGDTFSAIKGCDKTLNTCAGTLRTNGTPESADFKVRFGGTPFVPAPTSSI